jgi:4-phytase/acid phosphatase
MPTYPGFFFRLLFRLAVFLGIGLVCAVPVTRAAGTDGELKLVIVLTRHGVRSPLQANEVLGKYAAEPWPQWNVKPGILTPHGRQQMVGMGGYYRARYAAEGLLTGDAAKDAPLVFFRADNDQRTIESALAISDGLLPGAAAPNLHTRPAGQVDPLFQPVKAGMATPDHDLAIAAVSGRFGNDPANILQAYRPEFDALEQVLCGPSGQPPAGKISVTNLPMKVVPGTLDHTVSIEGALRVAEQIADALLLEYTEGLPMKDVGWGRMDSARLTQLLKLHSLYFDLTQATFYSAQVQASNLADHILQTLQRASGGPYAMEAFGKPEQKLIMVVGHDTNIVNFGGLLGINWYLPGTQLNPVLPGGALVIELRERRPEGRYFVRLLYLSQTVDQTRNLTPLTLDHPPAIAPIFLPGYSEAGPGYDVPFAKFEELLQRVTDPQFVLTGAP